ncbi:hypothetical protein GCM10025771_41030 [Niveibacterium umoris]|uniref:Uncharacterized protein n=1 Tax=Niveibacterium umoris TaxID=1193620 RepID=A0A840BET8_9RHOO|nr:hypothetical protein [Niveibacterium umoris]MBB4010694.1 hypothetical protein [Niveibacterium umoris]
MVDRKLIFVVLGVAFAVPCFAGDLKLPQSREDYKKLSEGAEAPAAVGRRGVVLRVTAVKRTERAPTLMDSQAARRSADIMSDRPLVATPAIGKGASEARSALAEVPKVEYQVVVRWTDGSVGVVRQEHDPKLKKGDAVSIVEGKLGRVAP